MYIENGHAFCPEYIQSRLKRAGVKADRDTYENLLTKYCQVGFIKLWYIFTCRVRQVN